MATLAERLAAAAKQLQSHNTILRDAMTAEIADEIAVMSREAEHVLNLLRDTHKALPSGLDADSFDLSEVDFKALARIYAMGGETEGLL